MATTPQGISRVLKNAGFEVSRSYKGRITWMHTEGFLVRYDWQKNIIVCYVFRTGGFTRNDDITKLIELENKAAKFLTSRGYTVTAGKGGWHVSK